MAGAARPINSHRPRSRTIPGPRLCCTVLQGKQYNDGEFPSGGVIADAFGNIYGTSSYGGTGDCVLLGIKGGCGTVFELSPPQRRMGMDLRHLVQLSRRQGWLPAIRRSGVRRCRQSLRSNLLWRRLGYKLRSVLPVLRDGVRAEPAEDKGRQVDGEGSAQFRGRAERSGPIRTAAWCSTTRARSTALRTEAATRPGNAVFSRAAAPCSS